MATSEIFWEPLQSTGDIIKLVAAVPIVNGRYAKPTAGMVGSWKAWTQQHLSGKPRFQQEREILESIPGRDEAYCLEKLVAWFDDQHRLRLQRWQNFAPARYVDCTLDNYTINAEDREQAKRQEAVLSRVRRFAESLPEHINNGVNIVFYGPPGTGKTHLMAALLRDAVVNIDCMVTWKTGAEIARESDPRNKDYGEKKTLAPGRYGPFEDFAPQRTDATKILAIDDPALPGQPLAYYALTATTSMVDEAYQDRNPVWITINATNQSQIVELISGPVADRLKDGALTAYFDWASHRRRGDF